MLSDTKVIREREREGEGGKKRERGREIERELHWISNSIGAAVAMCLVQ